MCQFGEQLLTLNNHLWRNSDLNNYIRSSPVGSISVCAGSSLLLARAIGSIYNNPLTPKNLLSYIVDWQSKNSSCFQRIYPQIALLATLSLIVDVCYSYNLKFDTCERLFLRSIFKFIGLTAMTYFYALAFNALINLF